MIAPLRCTRKQRNSGGSGVLGTADIELGMAATEAVQTYLRLKFPGAARSNFIHEFAHDMVSLCKQNEKTVDLATSSRRRPKASARSF